MVDSGDLTPFRGLLAVPLDVDETQRERGAYVSDLMRANATDFGPYGSS